MENSMSGGYTSPLRSPKLTKSGLTPSDICNWKGILDLAWRNILSSTPAATGGLGLQVIPPRQVPSIARGFLKRIKENTRSFTACGKRWGRGEFVVSCRTCEMDPTCAICMDCFQNGNHEDHDYQIHLSSGGVCDCGDALAWRPEGFCKNHSGAREDFDPATVLPADVVRSVSKAIRSIVDVIYTHCLHGTPRKLPAKTRPSNENKVADASRFRPRIAIGPALSFLLELAEYGDAFKNIIGKELVATANDLAPLVGRSKSGGDEIASSPSSSSSSSSSNTVAERFGCLSMLVRAQHHRRGSNKEDKSYLQLDERSRRRAKRLYFKLLVDLRFKKSFTRVFVSEYPRICKKPPLDGEEIPEEEPEQEEEGEDSDIDSEEGDAEEDGDDEDEEGDEGDTREQTTLAELSVQLFTVPAMALELVLDPSYNLFDKLLTMYDEAIRGLLKPRRLEVEIAAGIPESRARLIFDRGPDERSTYWRQGSDILYLLRNTVVSQEIAFSLQRSTIALTPSPAVLSALIATSEHNSVTGNPIAFRLDDETPRVSLFDRLLKTIAPLQGLNELSKQIKLHAQDVRPFPDIEYGLELELNLHEWLVAFHSGIIAGPSDPERHVSVEIGFKNMVESVIRAICVTERMPPLPASPLEREAAWPYITIHTPFHRLLSLILSAASKNWSLSPQNLISAALTSIAREKVQEDTQMDVAETGASLREAQYREWILTWITRGPMILQSFMAEIETFVPWWVRSATTAHIHYINRKTFRGDDLFLLQSLAGANATIGEPRSVSDTSLPPPSSFSLSTVLSSLAEDKFLKTTVDSFKLRHYFEASSAFLEKGNATKDETGLPSSRSLNPLQQRLEDWLDTSSESNRELLVESWLELLSILSLDRTTAGKMSDREIVVRFVVHALCAGDKTHSDIQKFVSMKGIANKSELIDEALSTYATTVHVSSGYRSAGAPTLWRLNPSAWARFEGPNFISYKTTELQSAMDNYQQQKSKPGSTLPLIPAPPLEEELISGLVESRTALLTSNALHKCLLLILNNVGLKKTTRTFPIASKVFNLIYLSLLWEQTKKGSIFHLPALKVIKPSTFYSTIFREGSVIPPSLSWVLNLSNDEQLSPLWPLVQGITRLVEQLSPHDPASPIAKPSSEPTKRLPEESTPDEEMQQKRRRNNQENKRRILEQMKQQQKAFAQALESKLLADLIEPEMEPATLDLCCVCREPCSTLKLDEPAGRICYLQRSRTLSLASEQATGKKAIDEVGKSFVEVKTIRQLDSDERHLEVILSSSGLGLNVETRAEGGIHYSTCGHYIHNSCYSTYVSSLLRGQHSQFQFRANVALGEFQCPLCRALSNSIIPVGAEVTINGPRPQITVRSLTDWWSTTSQLSGVISTIPTPPPLTSHLNDVINAFALRVSQVQQINMDAFELDDPARSIAALRVMSCIAYTIASAELACRPSSSSLISTLTPASTPGPGSSSSSSPFSPSTSTSSPSSSASVSLSSSSVFPTSLPTSSLSISESRFAYLSLLTNTTQASQLRQLISTGFYYRRRVNSTARLRTFESIFNNNPASNSWFLSRDLFSLFVRLVYIWPKPSTSSYSSSSASSASSSSSSASSPSHFSIDSSEISHLAYSLFCGVVAQALQTVCITRKKDVFTSPPSEPSSSTSPQARLEDLESTTLVLLHKVIYITTFHRTPPDSSSSWATTHDYSELVRSIEELVLSYLRRVVLFLALIDDKLAEEIRISPFADSYSSSDVTTAEEIAQLAKWLRFPSTSTEEGESEPKEKEEEGTKRKKTRSCVEEAAAVLLTQRALMTWCSVQCSSLPAPLLYPGTRAFSVSPLPRHFHDCLVKLCNIPCKRCNKAPPSPAICLLCGTTVCLRSALVDPCCRPGGKPELLWHATSCSGGKGIFFTPRDSGVFIVRGESHSTAHGTCFALYFDKYGEEDRGFRRGKPLFLDVNQYENLRMLWLKHQTDFECAKEPMEWNGI